MKTDVFSRTQRESAGTLTTFLLLGGVFAPLMYVGGDIIGGVLYPGYSFKTQAPSELFAIGAPTSSLVVILFSLSSTLCLAFALGVWRVSEGQRPLRLLALLLAANGIDSLVLWNIFPMHMRGVSPTLTDTMHLIFAVNPFVLLSIIVGGTGFRDWFRIYSLLTIVMVLVLAAVAFSYASQASANQPTEWLGLSERMSQYVHQLWHIVLAVMLLRLHVSTAEESMRAAA